MPADDRSIASLFQASPALTDLADALPGQGRWLALATVAVCMVGATGVAMRPILRRSFAGAAAAQEAGAAAARSAAAAAGRADPKVQGWVARLRELEAARVARNPMRYGRGEGGS
jgi:hypothetical protein